MDAVAGGRTRSAREEELLCLLAGFPDGGSASDRELSFSDLLVDAGAACKPNGAADEHTPSPRDEYHRNKLSPGKQEAAASKQQQATAREKRQRRQRGGGGGSRGSCGGSGDGVLLNFYVPGLRLTRSMTAPRPGRGATPPGAAPAKAAAAGKARAHQAPLGIGCWPALWGRGRTAAKACS